jgi:4-hydroxyproline epimerase
MAVSKDKVWVIDSHTGGEPTRVVIAGGPDLGRGPIAERQERFKNEFDDFRRAVVNEPRGSDVMVGALLCEPSNAECSAGVIFFNNVGYLGMCGHGTIGLIATLAYLGRLQPGPQRIETSVGIATANLNPDGSVTVINVPSYRTRSNVKLNVAGHGRIAGDVAWGGNWFFLTKECAIALDMENVERLTDLAWAIRRSLELEKITGENGEKIDHIELYGSPSSVDTDSKSFVLCPGGAYDRSPCGTGTSAKMACLYADGKLKPGQIWRQESILGSLFEGRVEIQDGRIIPSTTGNAYINAEAELVFDPRDPFCMGINRR